MVNNDIHTTPPPDQPPQSSYVTHVSIKYREKQEIIHILDVYYSRAVIVCARLPGVHDIICIPHHLLIIIHHHHHKFHEMGAIYYSIINPAAVLMLKKASLFIY